MRRAVFSEHVAREMIAPAQQRHLEFEPRRHAARAEYDVIRRTVLEATA